MKKIFLLSLACWAAFVGGTLFNPGTAVTAKETPAVTAFDRMEKSGVMRCGYMVWPPLVQKDPNTGAFSGVFYDLAQEMAKALNYKLEMTHEFGLATYQKDMARGVFDIECTGGWANAARGKKGLYTKPLAYFSIIAVVSPKHSDTSDLEWANHPNTRVAVMDGETSSLIRQERFPNSSALSLPHTASSVDLLMQVATGKADVTFVDQASAVRFDQANPGQIHLLTEMPVRVIPLTFGVAPGEERLIAVLNAAIDQLMFDGIIGRILDTYDPDASAFRRVQKPYQ
jgi:polar amino acid transport system substrate-binding protein